MCLEKRNTQKFGFQKSLDFKHPVIGHLQYRMGYLVCSAIREATLKVVVVFAVVVAATDGRTFRPAKCASQLRAPAQGLVHVLQRPVYLLVHLGRPQSTTE